MESAHIVVRVVFGYFFVLVLIRASGKRTVKQVDPLSFVMAAVLGDLFDDMFWAEVPAAEFVVAAATLVLVHLAGEIVKQSAGERTWRRASGRGTA